MDVLLSEIQCNRHMSTNLKRKQIFSPIPKKRTHILKSGKYHSAFKSWSNITVNDPPQPLERGLFDEFELEVKSMNSFDNTKYNHYIPL